MTVTLRPLTRDNLWAVVDLKLHPGQEGFVADNIDSIANAYVEPTFVPLGVYAGDELVGFAMYGQHPDTGAWWVIRLMIDREHQGKGYGRAAMEAVIAHDGRPGRLRGDRDQLRPANAVAAGLYASLGFRPTGEIEDGEPLLRAAARRSAIRAGPVTDDPPLLTTSGYSSAGADLASGGEAWRWRSSMKRIRSPRTTRRASPPGGCLVACPRQAASWRGSSANGVVMTALRRSSRPTCGGPWRRQSSHSADRGSPRFRMPGCVNATMASSMGCRSSGLPRNGPDASPFRILAARATRTLSRQQTIFCSILPRTGTGAPCLIIAHSANQWALDVAHSVDRPASCGIFGDGVEMGQGAARVGDGEVPVDAHRLLVAGRRPGGDLGFQRGGVGDAPVQALAGQHRELDLGQIQPGAMGGGVMQLQTRPDALRPRPAGRLCRARPGRGC